jgi:hypothetical protein
MLTSDRAQLAAELTTRKRARRLETTNGTSPNGSMPRLSHRRAVKEEPWLRSTSPAAINTDGLDGQEDHLMQLAQGLNQRIEDLRSSVKSATCD